MNREEFARSQREWTIPALSGLVRDCIGRYLSALRLLQIGGEPAGVLEHARRNGGLDLGPLLPFWSVVCDRYRSERYDGQGDLFGDEEKARLDAWSRFVYHELFPALCREDEFVRNVLRSVGLLPSRSPRAAAEALLRYAEDMAMPEGLPLWDPANPDG
jgi:hypothetical protein